MDVIFNWNLGNMIYNDLITLRLCVFSFTEIRSFQIGWGPFLQGRSLVMTDDDDSLGRHSELRISHAWLIMMKWRSKKLPNDNADGCHLASHHMSHRCGALESGQRSLQPDLAAPAICSSQSKSYARDFFIHINFDKSAFCPESDVYHIQSRLLVYEHS